MMYNKYKNSINEISIETIKKELEKVEESFKFNMTSSIMMAFPLTFFLTSVICEPSLFNPIILWTMRGLFTLSSVTEIGLFVKMIDRSNAITLLKKQCNKLENQEENSRINYKDEYHLDNLSFEKNDENLYVFDEEKLSEAGKSIFEMFNGEPKNINPLKEVEESEMKLYVLKPHNSTTNLKPIFFDNADEMNLYIKENGISNENIMLYTVEYKRHFADRTDVIVINSLSNNSKTKYMCAIDSDGYAEYDYEMSVYSGKYRWYFNYGEGYLDSIYEEFRKKGITFEREINFGLSKNRSEAIKMLKKTRKKI